MIHKPQLFAMTGGPGAGKTTLLSHLSARGHQVVPESARAIIQEEIARSGERPVGARFVAMALTRDIRAFHTVDGPAFLDRSLVDAWGSARLEGLSCPAAEDAVRNLRLNARVFIAPPWREIYVQDAERIQTWPQAVASYEACALAYADAGYELVELPLASVEDRATFVLETVAAA